jgi:hypothetical protein
MGSAECACLKGAMSAPDEVATVGVKVFMSEGTGSAIDSTARGRLWAARGVLFLDS